MVASPVEGVLGDLSQATKNRQTKKYNKTDTKTKNTKTPNKKKKKQTQKKN
jgi:hypothetical protein